MVYLTTDLINLLSSIEIPMIIVGLNQRIRCFTPQAEKLLKLIPTDIERPIGDIQPNIGILHLDEIVNEVIKSLTSWNSETQDRSGLWNRLLVKPYRKSDGKIDGAIAEKTLEGTLADIDNGQWNIPKLVYAIEMTLNTSTEFHDLEIEFQLPRVGPKYLVSSARRIPLLESELNTVLLVIEDCTQRIVSERNLKTSEEKYRNLISNAYDGMIVVRKDSTIEIANRQIESMFGYSSGELVNKKYETLIPKRNHSLDAYHHDKYFAHPTSRKMDRGITLFGRRKDGSRTGSICQFSQRRVFSNSIT